MYLHDNPTCVPACPQVSLACSPAAPESQFLRRDRRGIGIPEICITFVKGGPKQVNNKPNAARSTIENLPLIEMQHWDLALPKMKSKQNHLTLVLNYIVARAPVQCNRQVSK